MEKALNPLRALPREARKFFEINSLNLNKIHQKTVIFIYEYPYDPVNQCSQQPFGTTKHRITHSKMLTHQTLLLSHTSNLK